MTSKRLLKGKFETALTLVHTIIPSSNNEILPKRQALLVAGNDELDLEDVDFMTEKLNLIINE
ncbi:MAG: hypothetical protein Tsb005_13750 [Gammaproteobacteria bacterium]